MRNWKKKKRNFIVFTRLRFDFISAFLFLLSLHRIYRWIFGFPQKQKEFFFYFSFFLFRRNSIRKDFYIDLLKYTFQKRRKRKKKETYAMSFIQFAFFTSLRTHFCDENLLLRKLCVENYSFFRFFFWAPLSSLYWSRLSFQFRGEGSFLLNKFFFFFPSFTFTFFSLNRRENIAIV